MGDRSPSVAAVARDDDEGDGARGKRTHGGGDAAAKEDHLIKSRVTA